MQSLDTGTTIVTASRRLALELRHTYDASQLQSGVKAWRTPPIYYWQDWLNKLVDVASLSHDWPLRIDPHSAGILWEKCLAKHGGEPVLSFSSLVRQAKQSWQRLQDWCVPLAAISSASGSVDQRMFAKAAWAYRETLRSNHWVDAAILPQLVTDALRTGVIIPPDKILLAGFDRISPAVQQVVDTLQERNCSVSLQESEQRTESVACQSFLNREQELRAAGNWARQFLLLRPASSVAIVSPGLEANAASTTRLIREGLVPGWQYGDVASRDAVDVSYGRRLADYPAISVALRALRWLAGSLDTRDVSVLLRSPFIVSDRPAARSQLELDFRRWPYRHWTPSELAAIQRAKSDDSDVAEWLRFLGSLTELRASRTGNAEPAHWAERFDRFLAENQWPGSANNGSHDYQLIERWRKLLGEFSATGRVSSQVSLGAAVQRLCGMASELIFQPQSRSGIVHLTGMLETSGISYDAIWICGLDASRWPPAPNPLHLVSRKLQEEFGMPDATPYDNIEFAENVLRRIVDSAQVVVTSWSSTDGESETAPSPLLEKLLQRRETDRGTVVIDPGWHALALQNSNEVLVSVADDVPAVDEDEAVGGGAATVQLQRVDPFAAFARGRLGIRDIQSIEAGLPAALKGSVAHRILHTMFGGKPDSAAIAAWSEQEIADLIDRSSAGVIVPIARQLGPLHRRLLDLERERLGGILTEFIKAERDRSQFAIDSVEKEIDIDMHGVKLQLRIDRIDRLADNSLLVLDYKTGQAKSLLNRDGELNDLQLVVYATAIARENRGPIGGIALVNLDSRAISYKGTGGSVSWDAKRRDNWDQRLSSWFGLVDDAIRGLAAGDARVNVSQPPAQARSLALLSRFAELVNEH
jgi:probable DNA repair protein